MVQILPATKRLVDGLLQGNRTALSRSITLIESTLQSDRRQAEWLLDQVLEDRKAASNSPKEAMGSSLSSFRVGIAGPPGAGKSTFIETLGLQLTEKGHRVAVLAIDPSSSRTGGSILGDKTRMTHLSNDRRAFVRPSPSRGTLGGVAQHTNDIVLLCEVCGYDVILVESVGLGQSEIVIDDTVDTVLLLVPPAGGDELQGSKKGIMEIADLVVVNKADGDLQSAAKHTAVDYMHAMQLLRRKDPDWKTTVKMCSAREGKGITGVWNTLLEFKETMDKKDKIELKRSLQSSKWMWNQFHQELYNTAKTNTLLKTHATSVQSDLAHGFISPRSAARALLDTFLNQTKQT